MTRPLIAAALAILACAASPAAATTRTAQAERATLVRIATPVKSPLRTVLQPATVKRTRYDLPQMMARNFGTIGQRQLDGLVASVQ